MDLWYVLHRNRPGVRQFNSQIGFTIKYKYQSTVGEAYVQNCFQGTVTYQGLHPQ